MKENLVSVNWPKSKQAALNQAVYILNQMDVYTRRKENILKNKNLANEKIEKLKKVLEEYQTQIEAIDTSNSDWERHLENIKSSFNLTEAEILELKSSLLREKIQNLKAMAGIQDTGKSKDV